MTKYKIGDKVRVLHYIETEAYDEYKRYDEITGVLLRKGKPTLYYTGDDYYLDENYEEYELERYSDAEDQD